MASELVRRLQAARVYAGLDQAEFAEAIGTSKSTVERVETGKRDLKEIEIPGWIESAAKACGLPVAFFSVDFQQLDEMAARRGSSGLSNAQIIEMVTAAIDKAFDKTLGELELRPREQPEGLGLAGELARRARDSEPSEQRRDSTEPQAEEDAPSGRG